MPSTLISSKSTSRRSRSATDSTASTAMVANWSWALDTILLPRLVRATWVRLAVSVRLKWMTSDMRSSSATAMSQACS